MDFLVGSEGPPGLNGDPATGLLLGGGLSANDSNLLAVDIESLSGTVVDCLAVTTVTTVTTETTLMVELDSAAQEAADCSSASL